MLRAFAAYVINLDRSPERLRSAASQLDPMDLDWQRVRATDAATLADIPMAHYDTARFERHVGRKVDPSEIALVFSHLKAMRTFLDSPARFGLILEDDFEIADPAEFREILMALADCTDNWDYVRLSCGSGRYPLPLPLQQLTDRHVLAAPLMKFSCSAAYLISRRTAETLATALLPVDDPFDRLLDSPWRHDRHYRIVWPVPIQQRQGLKHTIDYATRNTKPPAWQRRGALLHRMASGLRRFAYNSRRGFFVPAWARSRPISPRGSS
jgi:glycosyl transferase, family 25